MARVPTYDSPQVAPGGAVPQGRLAMPEMSDAPGQQLQALGGAMQRFGQGVGNVALGMQQEAKLARDNSFRLRAKDADLRTMQQVDSLLYDPKNGFMTNQGRNVLDAYDVAFAELNAIRGRVMQGIDDPELQNLVGSAVDHRLQQARSLMDRHTGTELRKFDAQTADARAVSSLQMAAKDPTNGAGFEQALNVARNETLALAQMNGWDDATTALQFGKYRDLGAKMRYESWALTDPAAAFKHFREHGGALDPLQRDNIGNKLFQQAAPAMAKALVEQGAIPGVASPVAGQPATSGGATASAGGRYPARGLRNNNPGNIVQSGIQWAGQVEGNDPRFVSFATPEAGIAALGKNLIAYQAKHGLNTLQGIISRWAPASENNTNAYIAAVAKEIGVKADTPLNLRDSDTLTKLSRAIIRHENGQQPYDDATLAKGMAAALGTTALLATSTRQTAPADPVQAETGLPLIDGLPSHWKAHVLNLAKSQGRQAMADARESLRGRVQDASAEYLATGNATQPPTETEFIQAYGQAEGLTRFREFMDTATLGQTLQQVKNLPAAALGELVKTSTPQPGEGFATRQRNYELLVQAVDRVHKARSGDPVAFAAESGQYGIKPLEKVDDLPKLTQELRRRAAAAPRIAGDYGTPMALLTNGETKALSAMLRALPVEGQKQHLSALADGVGDLGMFRQVMQTIAPDAPTVAVAGIYQSRGLRTTDKRDVADLILRGQAILSPDKKTDGSGHAGGQSLVKMPEAKHMLDEWVSVTGDAFKGKEQAADLFMQTARAIYAARSAEDGDYSGVINARRWRAAIQLATGGIQRHNGSDIVMPYGMAYDKFRDGLQTRADALEKAGTLIGATARDVQRLPLENVGDGRYMLRRGAGYLVGKDGRPVVLDFNTAPR